METISKPCRSVEDCLGMVHLALSLRTKISKILSLLLLGSIHTLPFGADNCFFLTSLHLIMSSWFGTPIAGNGLPMLLPKVKSLQVPNSIVTHLSINADLSAQTFRDYSSGSQTSTEVGCSTECNIYFAAALQHKKRRSMSEWLSGLRVPTVSILRTGVAKYRSFQ